MVMYQQSHVVKPTLGRQKIKITGKNFDSTLEPVLSLQPSTTGLLLDSYPSLEN